MNKNRAIALWLLSVSALIAVMIVFGGWVRLTRSGLSMVDWNVITGTLPPLSASAWEAAFAAYKQTPEYVQINAGMPLSEFRFIYLMEWGHRILGRVTGLAFVIPLVIFAVRGSIVRARLPAFGMIAVLFAVQGLIGWFMVQSGLVDQPRVSHLRLTLHLSAAMVLLAACLWHGFGYAFGQPDPAQPRVSTGLRRLAALYLVLFGVQTVGGGLVAGLRAGYISGTFPFMLGQWLPDGLWRLQPWVANHLSNPVTVHFQHRWFAFVVLGAAAALARRARLEIVPSCLKPAATSVLHLTLVQVILGVATIVLHMPIWLASLHQAAAVAVLTAALLTCHRAFRA